MQIKPKKILHFQVAGFEDMELSTQIVIKEALNRGIEVKVLDRIANFFMLTKGAHREFIKEGTKTRLDSYISFLIMENKHVTKYILKKAGFSVPEGNYYHNYLAAVNDYDQYKGKKIVIKPLTTNFGIGINFIKKMGKAIYQESLERAFNFDKGVIVEEYIEGDEYRFLTIGDTTVAVCKRIPANVIGDSCHTIQQLVEIKNRDPRRGDDYTTPLTKIRLGKIEKTVLKNQGYTFKSIPKTMKQVFLRENSNISTGGDSIDMTDQMPEFYKKIANEAALAVKAKICGVDMIIKNFSKAATDSNYAIIELNFNPAIHFHAFPYQGKPRNVASKLLNMLGY